MKSSKFVLVLLVYLFSNTTVGQCQVPREYLIGDSVPDFQFKNLINFSKLTAKLSDFQNKLVILDFGATWCAPCVGSFPKLDSLQKKFEKSIQIIFITIEERKKVASFFEKLNKVKKILTPPTVVNDTLFQICFPYRELPQYVWINDKHKVVAITAGTDVNEYNISEILKGRTPWMALKKDHYNIERSGDLYTDIGLHYQEDDAVAIREMHDSTIAVYSALTKFIPELPAIGHFSPTTISLINHNIITLYKTALRGNKLENLNLTTSFVDIDDENLYKKITGKQKNGARAFGDGEGEKMAWYRNNNFSYELKVPSFLEKEKFSIMVEDLNRYFGASLGIEGIVENRNRKYLALIRTTTDDLLASKGGSMEVEYDNAFSIKIKNGGLGSNLYMALFKPMQSKPIILDETGYKGNVDLNITCQLSDLNAVNKELARYGLQLVEKEKVFETTVIRLKSTK